MRTFWIDERGVKYKMSNMQAAFGLAQFRKLDRITDAMMRQAADTLVSSGLADAGYDGPVTAEPFDAELSHGEPDEAAVGPGRSWRNAAGRDGWNRGFAWPFERRASVIVR